jgi:protein-S-isoprenylcysteine O-methyltransferase Ste14
VSKAVDSSSKDLPSLHPALSFLAVILAGLGLERWPGPPFALPGGPWTRCAGAVVAALAVALVAWGFLALRRHRTPVEPGHMPTSLVTDGPYRFTRNPLYLGQLLFLAGLGFAAFGWLLIGALLQGLLLDRLVIPAEEARIAAGFGEAFADYKRRVRRWL